MLPALATSLQGKMFPNVPCKLIIYLGMPWHGLLVAIVRIQIDIVVRSMTKEEAAMTFQISDELLPLHTTISLVW